MKILFVSPQQRHRYNPGHQLFRDEIARQHEMVFYGPLHPGFNKDKLVPVPALVKKHKPDVVMTYHAKYTLPIALQMDRVKIPKVHFAIDLFQPYIAENTRLFALHKYDLAFCFTTRAQEFLKQNGYIQNVHLLPFSVDTNWFKSSLEMPREVDVMASMSRANVYPNRAQVLQAIADMPIKSITKRVFDESYISCMEMSKIVVNSVCQWKSFNFKMLEGPACGAMLLTDKPRDFEAMGFIPDWNVVLYDGIEDMRKKILHYLMDDKKRHGVSMGGLTLVRSMHSCEHRVREMTQILEENL